MLYEVRNCEHSYVCWRRGVASAFTGVRTKERDVLVARL